MIIGWESGGGKKKDNRMGKWRREKIDNRMRKWRREEKR